MVTWKTRTVRRIAVSLLLWGALPAACTAGAGGEGNARAALERYRLKLAGMDPDHGMPPLEADHLLFVEAMRLVLSAHVDRPDPQVLVDNALEGVRRKRQSDPATPRHALTESAIEGMLAGLDPYSAFLDADLVSDLRERIHGEIAGIGVEVAMDGSTGFLRVVSSSRNSPAAQAGVRSGDLIVAIDGQQVRGVSLRDAATRMRGLPGRPVDLQVLRPDSRTPVRVTVTRTVLKVQPIVARLEDGDIAYVGVATFNEQTAQDLTQAMENLRSRAGGRLRGAVLDLRNNPGGLLEQGIKVSGQFLGQAEIVSTRGRSGGLQHYLSGDHADLLRGAPMVVLINGFSSSAAEIVAGALQDYGRALVIGGRSYGKGSVQTIFWLAGGQGIRLTTARYFRPSGATVECYGVLPNVTVEPPEHAAEAVPDREPCNHAMESPRPKAWAMAEACPEDAAHRPPGLPPDRPLACALSILRAGRSETAARR